MSGKLIPVFVSVFILLFGISAFLVKHHPTSKILDVVIAIMKAIVYASVIYLILVLVGV